MLSFRSMRISRPAVLLLGALTAAAPLRSQEGDDAGMAQFTRENTIRGTVTATAASGFEIRTESGDSWRVLYGVNSKLMKGREAAKAGDFHVGDLLFAAGNVDAKKKQVGAAILVDVNAAEVQKAREGLGKTWSAGRVTAVAGRQITIQRLDGIPQTIAVDENTSFQQRHESVTLAEVKPGTGVRAEGHLLNGVFTASVLHVLGSGHDPLLDGDGGKR